MHASYSIHVPVKRDVAVQVTEQDGSSFKRSKVKETPKRYSHAEEWAQLYMDL